MRNIKYIGTKAREDAFFDKTQIIWTPGKIDTVLDDAVATQMLTFREFEDAGDAMAAVGSLGIAATGLTVGGQALTAGQAALVRDGIGIDDIVTGAEMIGFQQAGSGTVPRTLQERGEDFVSLLDFDTLDDAAASGVRVYCPPGTYTHDTLVLANGTEFYGPRSAIFQNATADTASFYANGLSWFRIAGVTIKGRTDSTGVTDVNDRAAIVVSNCHDFMVEDCKFEQHAGSGVTVSRQGLYVNHGVIRNNTFIKGDMTATGTPYGTQDCATVQVYQYAKNIEVYGNYASGPWYCAFLAQDQVNDGASRIHNLKVYSNKWEGLANYGIVLYTLLTLPIESITDNGSGVFRVTTTLAHNLSGKDAVHLAACGTASGIWMPTVVSPTVFDLAGSVFIAGALLGELRMSENCCGEFHDNTVDGVNGDREFAPGNLPYGAGLYIQGAGGIVAHGNVFRRTNLFTNSETLTPASIGVNQATGRIQVTGGAIYDSGYSGVSLKCTGGVGPIFVGGGLQIIRPVRDAIRVASGRNVTIDGVDILAGQATLSGRVRADTAGSQVSFRNITMREFTATAATNAFEIADITDFEVVGCRVKNYKPAAQTFEGLRLTNLSKGLVQGNYFDGGASAYNALRVNGVTDTLIQGNAWRMTSDEAARETVAMSGVCTGTIYTNDNLHFAGRMGNTSTGGAMHTRESSNLSGGKTRQAGDTITNTNPGSGGVAIWVKTAASAGATNWQGLTLS